MSTAVGLMQRIRVALSAPGLALRSSEAQTDAAAIKLSSGTGAPNHTAVLNSIYVRTDASGVATLLYRNTDGGTTWEAAAVTTATLATDNAWTGTQDISKALTGTDELVNADATISHATQVGVAIDGTIAQLTNARTGGYAATFRSQTTSLAGDLNGVIYAGHYELAPTDGGGAVIHTAVYAAGGDYVTLAADNVYSGWGTGSAGVPDISIGWDGTRLRVTPLTADSAIRWGADGAGIDQLWYGDTAASILTWDQSADSLILSGVTKIKLQTIAAATGTAIPVTHSGSFPVTTAAAEMNTLADPTYLGQTISIFADTYAVGDRVITAASRINQAGHTTITLGAVGDFIKLEAITIGGALKWQVVATDGAATA
jgi:hypothetical protein